jgi:hypothetical protein
MSITYSECAFVALSIQHAVRMPYIVIGGLLGPTIFVHIISQTGRLSKKVNENEMCILFFSITFA